MPSGARGNRPEEVAVGGDPAAGLRADARRNRGQILAAAETVFAEQGVGVPVDEIARRAGVGVGTLYRHFPTKETLVEAVIVTHMERLVDEAALWAESDDPGAALFAFLRRMAEEATSKRDLVDALAGAGINVKDSAGGPKERLEAVTALLLERAQAVGVVRPDVTLSDLIGLVMGACMASDSPSVPCSRARMMEVVCDGLRAQGDAVPTPAPRSRPRS